MFYLTTHSAHFILRLYGVGHKVKDLSDSERGNPLPPHGLLFPISSNAPSHRQDSTYDGFCYTSRTEVNNMRFRLDSLILMTTKQTFLVQFFANKIK